VPKKTRKPVVSSNKLAQLLTSTGFRAIRVVAPWQNADVPKYIKIIEQFERKSRNNAKNTIIA
jgi:hypothetical protein